MSFPFFHGQGFKLKWGYFPYLRPINTVIGAPIPVEKTENPTDEQVSELHKRYIEELTKLFDDHKTKYGIAEKQLLTIQ